MRHGHTAREYHNYARDTQYVAGIYDAYGLGSAPRVESVLCPEHASFPRATVRPDQEFRLPAGNRSGNEAAARGD